MARGRGDRDVSETADTMLWQSTFEEHGSSLLAFLASRVGRRELAEDLLQEIFVRAMRRPDLRPDSAHIKTYLFTTAHHLVIDQRRRRRPRLFSEIDADPARALERLPAPAAEPAERGIDLERLRAHLAGALAELRPAHRTAFEEAVLHQRPYADVAARHGWTIQQVKINVHRGRKQVMERLHAMLGEDPETNDA
jgi:RNA polymerase sigma-70 factor (ECF subfamily)